MSAFTDSLCQPFKTMKGPVGPLRAINKAAWGVKLLPKSTIPQLMLWSRGHFLSPTEHMHTYSLASACVYWQ